MCKIDIGNGKVMSTENMKKLAEALESIEQNDGLDILATTLAECLCSIVARRSADNPQVIPVKTDFVEGEVHVVFGPGDSILNK